MTTTAKDLYKRLSQQDSGYFECQLPIMNETPKAIQFDASNAALSSIHRGVWIPKSQMEIVDGTEEGFDKRFFIKNWLYSKLK